MEYVMIFCFLFCAACTGVLTYKSLHSEKKSPFEDEKEPKSPFTDQEIDQIKQVLNLLTWGGEYENKD